MGARVEAVGHDDACVTDTDGMTRRRQPLKRQAAVAFLAMHAGLAFGQASVESFVITNTTDTQQRTTLAGERVELGAIRGATVTGYNNEVVANISASSVAIAESNFGTNRLEVGGNFTTFVGRDSIGRDAVGRVWSDGFASSTWRDQWTLTGPAQGSFVQMTVSGTFTGRLGMSAADLATRYPTTGAPYSIGIDYFGSFGLSSTNVHLDGADVLAADIDPLTGRFRIDWTVSGLAPIGSALSVSSILQADTRTPNLLCRYTNTSCSSGVTFESMSTARIGRIEVGGGATLSAASGDLIQRDGYYTYAAAETGPVAPVPEPSTYALFLAGLGGVAFMARRRQRQEAAAGAADLAA